MPTAFIAGATGYTGRATVEVLRSLELTVIAHVRPDSSRLETWTERFTKLGAQVDVSPWTPEAMSAALARHSPTWVFALLGTTRSRARQEGRDAVTAYEAVDYGLTRMLIDAAVSTEGSPLLVYLSSIGVRQGTRNPYLAARAKVEAYLQETSLPHVIARPSFISGANREEFRFGERAAAIVGDSALAFAALLGGQTLRERYASMTNTELAQGLVGLAQRGETGVMEASEIRTAAKDLRRTTAAT